MLHSSDKLMRDMPPHSVEAEMCLLASMMLDHAFARQVIPTLNAKSFFLTDHVIVFDAIKVIIEAGRPIDAIILRDELKKSDQLDGIGGGRYIGDILATVPSAAHGPEYAARVREHAARRAIIEAADSATRRAYSGDTDAAALAGELENAASAIMASRTSGDVIGFAEAIERAYDAIDKGVGEVIRTGLDALDAVITGIGCGETVIVAARPSMGKSTLARTIAKNVARDGSPVGLISLEESPAKIARNALASESMVDNHKIRAGNLAREEWDALAEAVTKLQRLPIFISRNARTVDEIRAVASTMKQKHGCKMIMIDHLSRVRAPGKSIYEVTTNASGAISDLIKDLHVAGIVLCQLNRGPEHRDDPRPSMSDLRDSGAIEQDADGILLLHREDYFHTGKPNYIATGIAEIIIAKWRDGMRGKTVKVKSDLRYQRFLDFTPQERSDAELPEALR